jgi:hypothetical protein
MDPAAIAANREGQLSSKQTVDLRSRARRSRVVRVAEALACIGLAVLLAALVIDLGRFGTVDAGVIVPSAGILLLLGLGFFGLRPWSDPLGDDVRAGRVESIFGVPARSERGSGLARAVMVLVHYPSSLFMPQTHVISIADTQFQVSSATLDAMDYGRAIRAYYLPRSMTLVSIAAS